MKGMAMGEVNFNFFTKTQTLKGINPPLLKQFLMRFKEYFADKDFDLEADVIDHKKLVEALMKPSVESKVAKDLADALYIIYEVSKDEAYKNELIDLSSDSEATYLDLIIQQWLKDQSVLVKKHAELSIKKVSAFDHYRSDVAPANNFEFPKARIIKKLETYLADTFEDKNRGKGATLNVFKKGDEFWFMVNRGSTITRKGSMVDGKPSSIVYRPERYDIVVYNSKSNELRVERKSDWLKCLYVKSIGAFVFGSADYFKKKDKYTLEPIRSNYGKSLNCKDVETVKSITLTGLILGWGKEDGYIQSYEAKDLGICIDNNTNGITNNLKSCKEILKATFKIIFKRTENDRKTTVIIKPPMQANHPRDSDAQLIEKWLINNGIILKGVCYE